MSSSSGSGSGDEEIVPEFHLMVQEEIVSSEDPPMSQWSSLESVLYYENKKKVLHSKGLYSPGSGELCANYIAMSDSDVFRHVYYKYPAVTDPGIKRALLSPEKPAIYPDDGRELYLALCKEMNKGPVRLFHRNLLSDEINLRYYCVDPFAVRPMAMALQYNQYVQRLDLTDNFLNDDACYHLGRMLIYNSTLRELILSGCRIKASGLACLIDNMSTNRRLSTLDISRNEIRETGGVKLAQKIDIGLSVPKLNLSKNELGKLTAQALVEALEFRNTMTHVDLSLNNFCLVPSTAKMLNVLAHNEVLEELNLSWNAMEGEKIAEAIKNILLCPRLAVLNLSNNKFFGQDVAIIASGLNKAKKLVTLDFSRNPLTTEDAQVLIERMKKAAVKLQNLLLENIDVGPEFVKILEKVRKMNSRKNFTIAYGHVTNAWTIIGPDPRELMLKRAAYLGTKEKRHKVDVPMFFLKLNKTYAKPIQIKELLNVVSAENVPLDENFLTELCNVFPAARAKVKSLHLASLCEYIKRLWPEKKLPPTPEPEHEPEVPLPPPPPPPPAANKGKAKK